MNDPVYFGWRRSLFGPPTCFKGERYEHVNVHTVADPHYPLIVQRELNVNELNLTLDELKVKYPLPVHVSHTGAK